LVAAAGIWLFFKLLDQTVSRRAAWIGAALLASDSSYLLLNTADYGPVTLQLFLKMAAMLLILRFHRTASRLSLAGGFLLLGVAMWDKAVFAWVLFGLALATLGVYRREVRQHLNARNIGIAAAATLLGGLPLVIYNFAHPLETLRANAKLEQAPVLAKADLLARTVDGYVLFGFLTAGEPGPDPGQPGHWFQSLSLRLAEWTRHPRHNLILVAFLIALPFLWRQDIRKPMLFALLLCLGTWLPMALTAGAGAAAQHTVLLWPFHLFVIAAALSRAPVKAAAAATAVLCLVNVAVTNQYYADLIRNGPAIRWTDAMDALNRNLLDSKAARVYTADWGFLETLNLINEGDLPVFGVDPAQAEGVGRMIADVNGVFVSHVALYAYYPEWRASIEDLARRQGYEEQHLATISDRNGRPTFDVFRFRKLHL
jgi:hypothetical protein